MMPLTRCERAGGLLLLAGVALLVGLRPVLRVVVRELAPGVAVRVHALRNELDPWGRPFVAPGITWVPGTQFGTRWTGPTYSKGPDGVDDTGSCRAPGELWFEEFRIDAKTNQTRCTWTHGPPPFDDRRNDGPAPAWDGHFQPLMAGDDVLVAWGTTPLVRLLGGPVEVVLGVLCLAAGWFLLLPAGPLSAVHRAPPSLARRVGLSGPPIALAAWLGALSAEQPEVAALGRLHPLVPAQLALGGTFALVALLAVVGLLALLARRRPEEPGASSSS